MIVVNAIIMLGLLGWALWERGEAQSWRDAHWIITERLRIAKLRNQFGQGRDARGRFMRKQP